MALDGRVLGQTGQDGGGSRRTDRSSHASCSSTCTPCASPSAPPPHVPSPATTLPFTPPLLPLLIPAFFHPHTTPHPHHSPLPYSQQRLLFSYPCHLRTSLRMAAAAAFLYSTLPFLHAKAVACFTTFPNNGRQDVCVDVLRDRQNSSLSLYLPTSTVPSLHPFFCVVALPHTTATHCLDYPATFTTIKALPLRLACCFLPATATHTLHPHTPPPHTTSPATTPTFLPPPAFLLPHLPAPTCCPAFPSRTPFPYHPTTYHFAITHTPCLRLHIVLVYFGCVAVTCLTCTHFAGGILEHMRQDRQFLFAFLFLF